MGLVTLGFLLAFTVLYLSKSLEKKPEFVSQAVTKINDHLDKVSLYGAAYAAIAALLTLIMVYGGGDMFVRLTANIMIILMALPFVFEKMMPKFQEKMNPVIIEEAKNVVGWVTKQEKYVGYAGAVISLLLFAVLFR
jgi:hypothetical protein